MLKFDSLVRRIQSAVLRYGLALVSVAVALAITSSLERYTTLRTPIFYTAIIISAWFGGMGPGLLAVVLSTVAIDYYFVPGAHKLSFDAARLPFTLLFSASAVLACWISVQRRRAEEALKKARDELEEKVIEGTSELRRTNEELQAEIGERKRVEEVLREQARLLDLTHDTVFVRDMRGVIMYWNRGAEELYGWTREESVGQVSHKLTQTIFPAPLGEIDAELFRTDRWEGQLIHTKRDGTQVVVASRWSLQRDGQGNPVAVLETNNDVTEVKRAEEALQKSQAELTHVSRIATMGELTASIAHEVNQPLAAVVTNANACLRWLGGQPSNLEEARDAVQRIIKEGNRASEVISRIRALVKKSPSRRESLDINVVILEVIALARSELHKNRIALKTHLSDRLPLVLADRIQLQQVILNLFINGVDAMSKISDGRRELVVSTETGEANGVLVAVRDSGAGLLPESLEHLFDAFFSTKADGMGMGLAISRSIIEGHGGRIWATPIAPHGAVFQFTLPNPGEGQS